VKTFDLDGFVDQCLRAIHDGDPHAATRELLAETVANPDPIIAKFGHGTKAELQPLFVNDELSVMRVIWAPGMSFGPHDHLIWAAIGVYAGAEDNAYFRLDREGTLTPSGVKRLEAGNAAVMGKDTIHAVHNPRGVFTEAIHVYGGNLGAQVGRRVWNPDTGASEPMSVELTQAYFEEVNRSLRGEGVELAERD
jgi:predicted metal-dependent enzyme (double-stranded beta helix superfamily)